MKMKKSIDHGFTDSEVNEKKMNDSTCEPLLNSFAELLNLSETFLNCESSSTVQCKSLYRKSHQMKHGKFPLPTFSTIKSTFLFAFITILIITNSGNISSTYSIIHVLRIFSNWSRFLEDLLELVKIS